jgi:hypothetical protein
VFGRDLGAREVAALWTAGSFAMAVAIGGVGLTTLAFAAGPAGAAPSASTTAQATAGAPSASTTAQATAGAPSASTTAQATAGAPSASGTAQASAGVASSSSTAERGSAGGGAVSSHVAARLGGGPRIARRHVPATACLVPGYRRLLNHLWRPGMGAAVAYARSRVGDIAFAVRTDHRFYGFRANHVEWSASVVKAMLLVAYLDLPSVANRPLDGYDVSLLIPMIEHSDNTAATTVIGIVGLSGLRALAARVGMKNFEPVLPIWGETHITPADQTKLFYSIDSYIVPLHRKFGMHLLASITPAQRWGIGEVTPHGWTPYFKGGWGSGTGLIDNQVVLLKRGCSRASLAVLTMRDGSHDYGKQTLKGIFERLLRGFPRGR